MPTCSRSRSAGVLLLWFCVTWTNRRRDVNLITCTRSYLIFVLWFLMYCIELCDCCVMCKFVSPTIHNTKRHWRSLFLARSANLPEGLYILLALISFFFVSFNDRLENNYLRIGFTDFRNLFTEWKRFGCRWLIWTFFRYLKGRCHGNQFLWKNGKLPSFVALAFRNEMG